MLRTVRRRHREFPVQTDSVRPLVCVAGSNLTRVARGFWLPILLIVAATGCGKGGMVPVKGVVKLNGQPLAHASVMFIAQDEGGKDATGTTDENGVFQLSTFKPGDGALKGKYKVVVQPAAVAEGGAAQSQEEAMQGSSKQPKPPSVVVAPRFSMPDQTVLVQEVPVKGDLILDVKSE